MNGKRVIKMSDLEAQTKFINWLINRITFAGRGDELDLLDVNPSGKLWAARLQPTEALKNNPLGDRAERLEPCAQGFKLNPKSDGPWSIRLVGEVKVWDYNKNQKTWKKSPAISVSLNAKIYPNKKYKLGHQEWEKAFTDTLNKKIYSAEFEIDTEYLVDGSLVLAFTLVNTSHPSDDYKHDHSLYECKFSVFDIETEDFLLESIEDSFRYNRKVPAFGINCGVEKIEGGFRTLDQIEVQSYRPSYWNVADQKPSMSFLNLYQDSIGPAKELSKSLRNWGELEWSGDALKLREVSEQWSPLMKEKAKYAAEEFYEECKRIDKGIALLQENEILNKAFSLMNASMSLSSRGNYDEWRPFQFGFLLANLSSVVNVTDESDIADVVWFATGGGKTETYLGLLVTAAFYDRLRGKLSGITAWSRFPLRMLSLQQTQRFADAIAAAEIIRRKNLIDGDPFSMGFFVGAEATPNSIDKDPKQGNPDPEDDSMPQRYQVLDKCPFCHQREIAMVFCKKTWKLQHQCKNESCDWFKVGLPIYVVDDEIYRFLPTIVVGTLDKAASIAMQASMRALVGAPIGKCARPDHGYTYAQRASKKNGCLVPDCNAEKIPLPIPENFYSPTFRLQDELHLLRDSLGAIDAHYEALYDGLQIGLSGRKAKILASSATLTGYKKQIETLYQRSARVFPVPSPRSTGGFWTSNSTSPMRKFIAIAPRGVTIEYTIDRLLSELQMAIRQLHENPEDTCKEIGIDKCFASMLVSIYGTDVVYGNTLRDLEAVSRSIRTQLEASGKVNTAELTGGTSFSEIRKTLERLQNPHEDFYQRDHVITASSMMSHGVDVDRLNVMVVLGHPLATAEFIQATARVGRKYPAVVFVIHKIGRERDAGIFRSFQQFVEQGDRFVEPIPITRKSRKVLELTIPGIVQARILTIHEPSYGAPLTTALALKKYYDKGLYNLDEERDAVINLLGFLNDADQRLRIDVQTWMDEFERNLKNIPSDAKFPSDLLPSENGVMTSLRNVEKAVPITGRRI